VSSVEKLTCRVCAGLDRGSTVDVRCWVNDEVQGADKACHSSIPVVRTSTLRLMIRDFEAAGLKGPAAAARRIIEFRGERP
jgi:hypothetical protein